MSRQYALRFEERCWTVNAERRMSPFERGRHVARWRAAFANLARAHNIPTLAAVVIEARPIVANRRSIPDTGACYPSIKAGVDGLVDAGVLSGDGPDIVRAVLMHAPLVAGSDALTITLVEVSTEGRVALDVDELATSR